MATDTNATAEAEEKAPDPDDPRKPDSPTDLTKPSIIYVLRKTAREFSQDQCTDLAAALTYYAVLSIFPAMLALVSLLGVFGQGKATTDAVLETVNSVAPTSAVDTLRPTIDQLVNTPSAGFALILGIATALWSASGYVGAFGRAMNRMYEIDEGRPFWKLRPLQLVLTFGGLVLAALVAFMLAVSGPIAKTIGGAIGLGDAAVTVWNIAKWPVLVVVFAFMLAVLYYASPNAKVGGFKWISPGAIVAVLVWIVASALFAFYVANFGSYDKTYGSLAGVVIFLVWLWISNVAILLGAQLNAERERSKQIEQGVPEAERDMQLEERDAPKEKQKKTTA